MLQTGPLGECKVMSEVYRLWVCLRFLNFQPRAMLPWSVLVLPLQQAFSSRDSKPVSLRHNEDCSGQTGRAACCSTTPIGGRLFVDLTPVAVLIIPKEALHSEPLGAVFVLKAGLHQEAVSMPRFGVALSRSQAAGACRITQAPDGSAAQLVPSSNRLAGPKSRSRAL